MQDVDGVECGVADALSRSTRGPILRAGFQEGKVLLQHVLDAKEHVAEAGLLHQRRERGAVTGEGRRHALHDVVDVVEAGLDDGAAQCLEPWYVDRDVVVDEEDGAGAAVASVGDVGDHARDGEAVEVAAAHFDDRAETAVEGAATRGFHDVDLPTHHRVAGQHAGGTIGTLERAVLDGRHRTRRIAPEDITVSIPEASDGRERRSLLERPNELAEGTFAFAADDEVNANRRISPGVRRQAGVVATNDDDGRRREGTNERDDASRGAALEGHHREADDVRCKVANQALDGGTDGVLREYQVGNGHLMMRVDVARQRGERAVGHADSQRRGVLERIGHGQQKNSHPTSGARILRRRATLVLFWRAHPAS